jgi:hypothetical protein
VDAAGLAALEAALYGTAGQDPRLPSPAEVIAFFSGTVVEVTPTEPTYVEGTHTLTIPAVTGVEYFNDEDGKKFAAGDTVLTEDTVVRAEPTAGHSFPPVTDNTWFYNF